MLATSLNRLTSVIAYMSHERIWKRAFSISIIFAVFIAISLSWFYFFAETVLIPMDLRAVTYGTGMQVTIFKFPSSLALALFGLICGSLDLTVNAITCMMIYHNSRVNGSFNRIALGLMGITLIEFATQMLVFAAEGALFLLGNMMIYDGIYNDFYFAMCWISQLNALLKPYTLLLLSATVRECFYNTYWRKMTENSLLKSVSHRVHVVNQPS